MASKLLNKRAIAATAEYCHIRFLLVIIATLREKAYL